MGVDIEMLVIIPTSERARIADLAKTFPRPPEPTSATSHNVQTFLDAMATLRGEFHGQAPEYLLTYTSPHNRVHPPSFVHELKEFWSALFKVGPDGLGILCGQRSILVMWHEEQGLETKVIEISRLPEGDGIGFTSHELPFFWTYP